MAKASTRSLEHMGQQDKPDVSNKFNGSSSILHAADNILREPMKIGVVSNRPGDEQVCRGCRSFGYLRYGEKLTSTIVNVLRVC